MNNKGWGLWDLILIVVVLGAALVFAFYMANNNLNIPVETGILPKEEETNKEENNKEENKEEQKEENKEENKEETNIDKYKALESKLTLAANSYIKDVYKDKRNADDVIVTLKKLVDSQYILPIYDIEDNTQKCIGYVDVSLIDNELEYASYIKCGDNYQSEGIVLRNAQ